MNIFVTALLATLGIIVGIAAGVFITGFAIGVFRGIRDRLDDSAKRAYRATLHERRALHNAQWRIAAEALMVSDDTLCQLIQELRKYPYMENGSNSTRNRLQAQLRLSVSDPNIRAALYDISTGK